MIEDEEERRVKRRSRVSRARGDVEERFFIPTPGYRRPKGGALPSRRGSKKEER